MIVHKWDLSTIKMLVPSWSSLLVLLNSRTFSSMRGSSSLRWVFLIEILIHVGRFCFCRDLCIVDASHGFSGKPVIWVCIKKQCLIIFILLCLDRMFCLGLSQKKESCFLIGPRRIKIPPLFLFWEMCACQFKTVCLKSYLTVISEINSWWAIIF